MNSILNKGKQNNGGCINRLMFRMTHTQTHTHT